MNDTDLLPLDEAARRAFPAGGVDGNTLKRRARQGKLTVYKPGKMLMTTLADVQTMIEACRVEQKASSAASRAKTASPPGSSSTAVVNSALERQLAILEQPSSR